MAKFGYLYLNNGLWNETQIIPKDWVETSISSLSNLDYYFAAGLYGQKIMVIPDEDMVVVFTAIFGILIAWKRKY